VYTEKAIAMAGESVGLKTNGHRTAASAPQKSPKRKQARRAVVNGNRNLPEVGSDELLGQQHPGDAVTAVAPAGDEAVVEIGVEELTGEQQPGDSVQAADAGSGDQL
jgi:arginine decarboxylase